MLDLLAARGSDFDPVNAATALHKTAAGAAEPAPPDGAAAARGFGEVAWGAALPRDRGSAVRTCPGATKVCLAAV